MSRAITRIQSVALIAILVVAAAAGVYYFLAIGPSKQGGTTFVYDDNLEPTSMDPAVDYSGSGWGVIQNVFQTLVFYDHSSTTQFVGILAQSWQKSADGSTWTFTLRQGVKFSNGDPFNATVMAYSLKRTLTMNQGPSALLSGVLTTGGITAVDAYTLQIVLSNPSPAVLAILSTPPSSAVDPQVVEANGGIVANQTNTYMSTHPVGTGPFVFKEWVKGDHITLLNNPSYWGGANGMFPTPKLTQVVINYKTDALARELDVESGAAQMIQLDLGHIADVQNQTGVTVQNIGVAPIILYAFMNTQKAPFDNVLVRQALTHAINYDEIVQQVYSGFAARYTGPLAVGVPTYNTSIPEQSYNVTLAKQLLAQAGYPNGQGLPTMQFVIWAGDPTVQNMAELILSQLAAVNINIQLQVVSFSTFMDMQSSAASNPSHPLVGITEWGADYLDPDDFATPIVWSQGFDNPAGYNNSAVDQLVMAGRYNQDPAQRAQIYSQITQLTAQDAPFAWLVQIGQFFIHRSNVQGLYYNPSLGRIDLSQISLSG